MKSQKEAEFQMSLASAFVKAGYRAALTDAGTGEWDLRFSTKGRIKPDLLVVPEKGEVREIVAIETKTDGSNSISESLDGIQKVIRLSLEKDLKYFVWRKGGKGAAKEVGCPKKYFLATQMSVREGVLCRWKDTFSNVSWGEEAHRYLTVCVNMLLERYGCGLLRKGIYPCPIFVEPS